MAAATGTRATAARAPQLGRAYQFTVEGKTITLTEEQYKAEVARIARKLALDLDLLAGEVSYNARQHDEFMEETHGWAGVVSDILGDTVPPHKAIWTWPRPAMEAARKALQEGRIDAAGRQLKLAHSVFRDAQKEWNTYLEKTIGGAQTAVTTLEITRDVSFAIAIGAAAVVAAPIVATAAAGAAGAAGLTGVAATTATAIGTGVTVTTGGAVVGGVLRGGTSAAGQALSGGPVSLEQVKKEAIEGAKRGAVDAGSAVVGLGAAKALGVGAQGLSASQNIIRGAGAGTTAGAFGGGFGAALEGKSGGEILEASLQGGATGAFGGTLGAATGQALGQSARAGTKILAESGTGAAGGAFGAWIAGGSAEDIKMGAITGAAGGISGGARPGAGTGQRRGAAVEVEPRAQQRTPAPQAQADQPAPRPAPPGETNVPPEKMPQPAARATEQVGPTPRPATAGQPVRPPQASERVKPPGGRGGGKRRGGKSRRSDQDLELRRMSEEEEAVERRDRRASEGEKGKRRARDEARRASRREPDNPLAKREADVKHRLADLDRKAAAGEFASMAASKKRAAVAEYDALLAELGETDIQAQGRASGFQEQVMTPTAAREAGLAQPEYSAGGRLLPEQAPSRSAKRRRWEPPDRPRRLARPDYEDPRPRARRGGKRPFTDLKKHRLDLRPESGPEVARTVYDEIVAKSAALPDRPHVIKFDFPPPLDVQRQMAAILLQPDGPIVEVRFGDAAFRVGDVEPAPRPSEPRPRRKNAKTKAKKT